jgi:hypothetical protein
VIVVAFMVGTVAHAAEPPLSLAGGETARPLTFTKAGDSESATLMLIVRNGGEVGGTLLVRFVDDSGATAKVSTKATPVELPNASATKKPPPATPDESPSFTVHLLTPSDLAIAAHDATQLRLEFRRAAKPAHQNAVSGNLIIALGSKPPGSVAGPVVVTVTINEPAAPNTDLKFEQDKATISLTRWFGPINNLFSGCTECMGGESVEVGTRGQTPAKSKATINSETGGTANVKLERESDSQSKLRVTRLDRHGGYEGKLVLDPDAEKPRSLTVAVKARDFIAWPLGAVLLGAVVGALFLKRHETKRNRDLVEAMIQDSVNPYIAARKAPDGQAQRPDRFYLNDLLPSDSSPVYPQKGGCKNVDSLAPVPRLYCEAAKLNGNQSLADLLPQVSEVTARFDRWRKVEAAISALKQALARLPSDAKHAPMRADAASMLVRGNLEPDDDKAASDLVLLLHAEAAATAAYGRARDLYDNHTTQPWRDQHKNVDPDKDLDRYEPAPTRTVTNAEKVALTLLYKVAALNEPNKIPPDPEPQKQQRHFEVMEARGTRVAMWYLPREDKELFAIAESIPPDNVDTRTPEQIRREVRRADWTIFWITAALTALVYLSGKYSSDWGSWEDYLFAFAAGAVAPTVITWTLIPYSRSYRPQAAAAPTAAG